MLSAVDGTLQASQRTDYYPFGLSFENNNLNKNKYLFSGKEFQDGQVNGSMLGWYDFGARFYDPVLGRWFNVDPAAQFANPYLYCVNNPVMYIDPDGEFVPMLLVGALFGGVFNFAIHGADFTWKGLAHFGVGALAGAAGAGVGAGIGAAYAGGASFGAGFLGTAGAAGSTGFFAGAAAGLGAGLTSGFITGAGNSWIAGGNFGQGLRDGFKGGLLGGLTGGLTGGIIGGADALFKGTNFFTGVGKFNINDGIAASITGFAPADLPEETFTGTYVGKFEGVKVYETKAFNGGITIPERGIIVSKGAFAARNRWGEALLQHEFGHILQYKMIGPRAYYGIVAKESLASATLHGVGGHDHGAAWMEKWANYLSNDYFGSRSILPRYPQFYPIENISRFNMLRIRLFNFKVPSGWPFLMF